MVAFPSGPQGGGAASSGFGSAFGGAPGGGAAPSGGGVGGLNAFLSGPFQDFTEGLGAAIAAGKKDQAYIQYMNEKRSKRTRMQFDSAMRPMEMVTELIAKQPELAKLYAPGGPYDDFWPTQAELIRSTAYSAGLDGDAIVKGYEATWQGIATAPPPSAEPTAQQKNLAFAKEQGIQPGSPEWIALDLGQAPDPTMRKSLGTYPGANGQEMVIIMEPDGSISSEPAGARMAPQPLVSQTFGVDPNTGEFVMGGGGTGGGAAVAGGGGGPGGGPGVMPVGKPPYTAIQGINERVADLDNGVKLVDSLLGVAGQPGAQFGAVGGVKASVRELFRVGSDVSTLVPGANAAFSGIAELANKTLQQDIDAGTIDADAATSVLTSGDPAVDAKALEARIQYLYARMLKGPDQRMNIQDIQAAKQSTKLFGLRSEQAVVQNLLVLRQAMAQNRQALQKSSGLTPQGVPEAPTLGEHEGLTGRGKPQTAAPSELPRVSSDADYTRLKSGDHFIDPEGNERVKP